ncbi:CoA-binding protein [Thioclava sp. BHET1]|nr:CoA-binding protein [Thioclava sp. BHET1]
MQDVDIRDILTRTRVIAVVGISHKPERPSYQIARFLQEKGYKIVPVNPGLAGQELLGEIVYPDLAAIPKDAGVDMVDIFRKSEAVPEIVESVLRDLPSAKTIWMQIGVIHDGAAQVARSAGLDVVMKRCPKVEFPRVMAGA